MTREDKELQLKDLCARLPYGVIIKSISGDDYGRAIDICYPQGVVAYMGQKMDAYSEEFLPYLRPMSSMTEEERLEYEKRSNSDHEQCYELRANGCDRLEILEQDAYTAAFDLEWLNENHFDYRGLIKKDLALEAPEGMYKIE